MSRINTFRINPYNIIKDLDSKDIIRKIIDYIPPTNYFLKKRKLIWFKDEYFTWDIYIVLEYKFSPNKLTIVKHSDFILKPYHIIKCLKFDINVDNSPRSMYIRSNVCEHVQFENLEDWRKELFKFGAKLDATDFQGIWYTSKIIEYNKNNCMIKIRYDGWTSRWDHWIPANHPFLLAPHNTKAYGGKENLKENVFSLNDHFLQYNLVPQNILQKYENSIIQQEYYELMNLE